MKPLHRLLWKYDKNMLPKDLMRDHISQARSALLERNKYLKVPSAGPLNCQVLLDLGKKVDSRIRDVNEANRAGDFKHASNALDSADAAICSLEQAETASRAILLSRESYKCLLELVGHTPLKEFSAIALVSRTIERAEEIWNSGLFRQALFIACMASEEASRFLSINAASEPKGLLMERLEVIEKSCAFLRRSMPWPVPVESTKSCIIAIQRIATEGLTNLAEDLTSELESLTRSQVEFSSLLIAIIENEEPDPNQINTIIHTCGMTNEDSWRTANFRIVETYLAVLSKGSRGTPSI